MRKDSVNEQIDKLGIQVINGITPESGYSNVVKEANDFFRLLIGQPDKDTASYIETQLKYLNQKYNHFFDDSSLKDILQESIKTFIESLPKIKAKIENSDDFKISNFIKWLVYNKFREAYKKEEKNRKRMAEIEIPDAAYFEPSFENEIVSSDLFEKILDDLPRRDRELLTLTYIENLSPVEIVRKLELSDKNHYYTLLSRARKRARAKRDV